MPYVSVQNVTRLRTRLTVAASFGLDEWRVLIEAVATIVAAHVALRLVDLPRVVSWASRSRPPQVVGGSSRDIEYIARFVAVAGRLTGLQCLPRSLALKRMLARRGVATELRIGVRTEGGSLLAHAWVEWMGHALNDDEQSLQPFAVFDRPLGGAFHG